MDQKTFAQPLLVGGRTHTLYDINALESRGIADIRRLPISIKILVENLLRKFDGRVVQENDVVNIARWQRSYSQPVEIPYHPARVLMQDFTGVPAVVDLAAMRDAVHRLGGEASRINPLVPVELIADHSVQVDYFGTSVACAQNVQREYERNRERYALLKWAQQSFDNFKVVPPNSGICHQVNLEHLGRVVVDQEQGGRSVVFPDTLVGTDSHTTMINGVGVMGWGVGGIEAEAVMLGQPYYMSIPEVVGVRLKGELQAGITATDVVLTLTEMLRKVNVVEKFVEYFGPGLKHLAVADRATIANMSPEYGATMGFFPVDTETLTYLQATGRGERCALVEAYTKAQGLFYNQNSEAEYTQVVELDLSRVEPSLAGPSRPQDRMGLQEVKSGFAAILGCEYDRDTDVANMSRFHDESGCRTVRAQTCRPIRQRMYAVDLNGTEEKIGDGSIVIAALTSCTNTSNPQVMLGAGLLARNAVERGLRMPPCVKTSLAPGSKVVLGYLKNAGLMCYLEALGFHTVGFGCTTCIGNSGPLHPEIERVIEEKDLNVAAILSGNRNFEARIHQRIKSNFLASPPLVVAFALTGRIDVDLTVEPVGLDPNGQPVFLKEIWPTAAEIQDLVQRHVKPELFSSEYGRIFDGDEFWRALPTATGTIYDWDPHSTYIRKPPFFDNFQMTPPLPADIEAARTLLLLGDTVTTDHISPAGAIPEAYPAGQYLIDQTVDPAEFNSYGSRRGNHEVMMRGTFGNIRIKNQMVAPREGSMTRKQPDGDDMYIYDAARAYQTEGVAQLVLGGKEYGTGSSRDWAAKGTRLLGIGAVIARSFERIHRNNLVGMGVLPLTFMEGQSHASLGLDGSETYSIENIAGMTPGKRLRVKAQKTDGRVIEFDVNARLDTEVDVAYFQHGGILPFVLRKIMRPGDS